MSCVLPWTVQFQAPLLGEPPVAAFDFDGTLTYCDSLLPFLRFVRGRRYFWQQLLRLSPILLACLLGLVSRDRAKQALLSAIVSRIEVSYLDAVARSFAADVLPAMINSRALNRLAEHVRAGHRVFIVSAS